MQYKSFVEKLITPLSVSSAGEDLAGDITYAQAQCEQTIIYQSAELKRQLIDHK